MAKHRTSRAVVMWATVWSLGLTILELILGIVAFYIFIVFFLLLA